MIHAATTRPACLYLFKTNNQIQFYRSDPKRFQIISCFLFLSQLSDNHNAHKCFTKQLLTNL